MPFVAIGRTQRPRHTLFIRQYTYTAHGSSRIIEGWQVVFKLLGSYADLLIGVQITLKIFSFLQSLKDKWVKKLKILQKTRRLLWWVWFVESNALDTVASLIEKIRSKGWV